MDEPELQGEAMEAAGPQVEVDQEKLAALMARMKAEQSIPRGLLAGIVAGLVAAIVWGFIAKVSGYEIGWLAIGVGFLVGIAVRTFGKGIDVQFNVMGAVLALLSVLVGKIVAISMYIAKQEGLDAFDVFNQLSVSEMIEVLKLTFNGIDLLFYGLAVWAGWQYSTRRITQAELAGVLRPVTPPEEEAP